ncbi:hypothetical protein [Sphingobacterium sp. CZ-UAM]|uniref:hypothetical protein n=1 Tax=Sphingobacterium sp. CZ-UAM TaxID=1933868 RepID=UPI001115923E|nr:hypothetical protein [Sphingobacterium sp. CZ-UAM]
MFFFIFSLVFISCNTKNKGEWKVADISRDTIFSAETGVRDATTMILKIQGNSDDSIKVHGFSIPGGNINKELRVDWYNSKISVKYESYRAKKGNIKIQYDVPKVF